MSESLDTASLESVLEALKIMATKLEERPKRPDWEKLLLQLIFAGIVGVAGYLALDWANSPKAALDKQELILREHQQSLHEHETAFSTLRERLMKQETTLGHIQDATVQNSVEIRETRRLLEQLIQQKKDGR